MENDFLLLDIRFTPSIRSCYNMVGSASENWGDFFGKIHSSGSITDKCIFGNSVLAENAERMESGIECFAQRM